MTAVGFDSSCRFERGISIWMFEFRALTEHNSPFPDRIDDEGEKGVS